MPTYDYECDACQHSFELFQSFSDPVETKCPECGKKKLRRLFGTGAAVVFKGSGFYTTDYRSESYKKAAESDKKSGESSSSDSKGSDSKGKESKNSDAKPAGSKSSETNSAGGKSPEAKPAKSDKPSKSK